MMDHAYRQKKQIMSRQLLLGVATFSTSIALGFAAIMFGAALISGLIGG